MIKANLLLKILLLILLPGIFISCLDPYNPPAISSGEKLLVVDGRINTGNGITVIQLQRTRNLAKDTSAYLETRAKVWIESSANEVFELAEMPGGVYHSSNNNYNPSLQYRLRIRTSDRKEYLSEFVEVKNTPPIDSVTWEKKSDGVQIYTTSHDAEGKTKYYQYEYDEAWAFKSFAYSSLKHVDGEFVTRPVAEQIYECFRYSKSKIISVATSENLNEDIIYKYPLIYVPATETNKLSVKYSILVRQFALTKEAFTYWQNLKKVTEEIGSLFDPQPSTFKGNIYCTTDNNELVLGFISAGNYTEKRLFIDRSQYGYTSRVYTGYEGCELDTVPGNGIIPKVFNPSNIPVYEFMGMDGIPQLLNGSRGCIDCTVMGSPVKPDFWQ